MVWLIAAGLHPRAGATTQRVAEDLAGRMDYDTGHVRYCLDETAARLGVNRATVKRHIKVLRELGTLAWLVHGTRTNIRRALGMPGYAGTATVYAAVIPPVYDHAMGHRLVGAGYTARIVVEHTAGPVDNSPVENLDAPPSLSVVKEERKMKVEGGWNYTSRASRPTASTSPTRKRSSSAGAPRRSPAQVARDCRIAAQVRPRVNWTQSERNLRRLAFALRPLIDQGMDVHDITAELHSWLLLWRPARPAAYIRAQLAEQAAQESVAAAATAPMDNSEWRAWAEADALRQMEAALNQTPLRTDEDRGMAREYAWHDPQIVTDHITDHGVDDALDLYGSRLVSLAESLTASGVQFTARW
ncbi:cell wall protein [Streptomyces sp.]|uniref:cell wall protein n=1 Tax=Streptomyces sp. TaxID=1931 RepID=UPI002F4281CD